MLAIRRRPAVLRQRLLHHPAPPPGERIAFKPGGAGLVHAEHQAFLAAAAPFFHRLERTGHLRDFHGQGDGRFHLLARARTSRHPVFLEDPYGSFVPQPDSNLFLITGGIGVMPAMSMLRTMRDDRDRRQAGLIYGSSTWQDIGLREKLDSSLICCVTGASTRKHHPHEECLLGPRDAWRRERGARKARHGCHRAVQGAPA